MGWLRPNGVADEFSSLAIGQTIFTPHNIVTYSPALGDRPFAGHSWVAAESSWVREASEADPEDPKSKPRHRKRVTLEASAGVIGPVALSHVFQSAFHVLRESRIPKGWFSQLGDRPQANVLLRFEDIFIRTCNGKGFDFTNTERFAVGTTQSYVAVGGTARLSPFELPGFPGNRIGFSAAGRTAPKKFGFALVGGAEARWMAHNSFLGDRQDIRRESLIYEWTYGVEARWKEWRLSYTQVERSREFETDRPEIPERHAYAAIQITRTEPVAPSSFTFAKLRGLRANLRFGKGRSHVTPGVPADPGVSHAASWGAEKSLTKRLSLGWEKTGLAREQGPPGSTRCALIAAPCHRDTFLLANVVTFGVQLLPGPLENRALSLQLRGGAGSAAIKVEETPDTGAILEPSKEQFGIARSNGLAWLAGLRATHRLGEPVSATADLALSQLNLDGEARQRARYWTATFGLQLHPWGRDH
jgi:hypothetical protein